VGFYRYMDHLPEGAMSPQQNPLVPRGVETGSLRKRTNQEIKRVFPEPRLEEDERGEINATA